MRIPAAKSCALGAVLILGLSIFLFSRRDGQALEVPVPGNLDQLDPRLRSYVMEKVRWVRENPRNMRRQATLGIVYAANSLWQEARIAFQNAATLDPKEPLAPLYAAIATQELGDSNEALKMFRQITARFPAFPQGYYRLGDALLRTGLVDEAEPAFQSLITFAPQEWRGYAGRGEVKLRKGDRAEAAKWLEKAIRIDSNAKKAHYLLGLAYRGLGRMEDAQIELLLGVNEASYPMPDPWGELAYRHMKLPQDQIDITEYLQTGEPAKAVQMLEDALADRPDNVSLMNNLALAYNHSGQPAKARELLLRALQKNDHDLPVCVTMSFSCQMLGLSEEALSYAEKAVRLSTNSPQGYLAKANALLATERDDEALASLEMALRCDPQNAEIHVEMGDVYLKNLNRPEQALDHYKQAGQLNPALASAQVRLAQMHIERGEANEARAALSRLRRISPANPALGILDQRLRRLTGQAKDK